MNVIVAVLAQVQVVVYDAATSARPVAMLEAHNLVKPCVTDERRLATCIELAKAQHHMAILAANSSDEQGKHVAAMDGNRTDRNRLSAA